VKDNHGTRNDSRARDKKRYLKGYNEYKEFSRT
jgi:hypothetical protein